MTMRDDRRGIGAHPLADEAEASKRGNQFVEETEDRFVERDIDILAEAGIVAMTQREQRSESAVETGEIIAEAHRALRRRFAAGIPGKVRDAAESVGDAREPRAVF